MFLLGIGEDIITALSKISNLLVVARNSTFTYKGRAVDVKQVGREQGVRFVLESSVRRGGDRVRITAQLIDVTTGHHLWAQRYDREFKDIFALQDEITEKIMVAMHVEITEGYDYSDIHARVRTPEAFELLMKARVRWLLNNKEDHAINKELVAKAAAIEPDNPEIWLNQAWLYFRDYQRRWSDDRQASLLRLCGRGSDAARIGEAVFGPVPNAGSCL